ncbi:COA8 family protein CBG23705, mitochondrial-like [Ornithodoros turicata]|uniref:COA8 family protein CBG23705, mitochondrial-like n=1 Tax=Ornithodoros turicata TaxID=34597 RepID=UPI00313A1338
MKGMKRLFSSLLKNNKTAAVKVRTEDDVISAADVTRLRSASTFVSPPHPVSNLREVLLRVPGDESKAEAEFRQMTASLHSWNQAYWEQHNQAFRSEKELYTKRKLEELKKEGIVKESLTAEEMAEFYRHFLNDNHKKHMMYNWTWYGKNFGLLWPALRASWSSLQRQGFGFRIKKI